MPTASSNIKPTLCCVGNGSCCKGAYWKGAYCKLQGGLLQGGLLHGGLLQGGPLQVAPSNLLRAVLAGDPDAREARGPSNYCTEENNVLAQSLYLIVATSQCRRLSMQLVPVCQWSWDWPPLHAIGASLAMELGLATFPCNWCQSLNGAGTGHLN